MKLETAERCNAEDCAIVVEYPNDCHWCGKRYCWSHLYSVEVDDPVHDCGIDSFACGTCLAQEFEERELQMNRLKDDDGMGPELRQLRSQLRRRELEKEALRRQLQKLGVKPCC